MQYSSMIAVGAIIIEGDKILLVQQSEIKGADAFKWGLPAGRWDEKENLVEGCIREVLEETGYIFTPKSLIGIYSRTVNYPDGGGKNKINIIFKGDVSGSQQLLAEDIIQAQWFSINEVLSMDEEKLRNTYVKSMIRDCVSGSSVNINFLKHFS